MAAGLGFVGIGSMGAPMARRLLEHGHDLVVYDARPPALGALAAAGAAAASSPRDVADRAATVFLCLPSNETCRDAVLGPTGAIHGSTLRTIVNLGTTGALFARNLASALNERSIALLDAPVSGGRAGAEKGTLAVMASGPRAEFERVEPLLCHLGANVVFIGEKPGEAQLLKVINNVLSATAFAVTAEGFVLGAKAGLDPEVMTRVINASSGRNSATVDKFPRTVLTRTFDLGATTDIILKDLTLCLADAEALGVPMWVGTIVRQLFLLHAAQAGGQQDLTTLVHQVEAWAGVEIPKVSSPRQ